MSAWPQLSAPIFAGDNFSIAKALSAATVNRPAAVPKESPVHNPTPPGRAALSYDHGVAQAVIPYADRRGF